MRMLQLIDINTNDSMLVDRFLVLAADMPEHEKLEATLKLARTLLKKAPRKAMDVAWMVYNSSLRDGESLSLIAEAFEKLGKTGKAEVIRSELKRINNTNLSPEVRNMARLTVEEHVTTTLAEKIQDLPLEASNDNAPAASLPMPSLNLESLLAPQAKGLDAEKSAKIDGKEQADKRLSQNTTLLDRQPVAHPTTPKPLETVAHLDLDEKSSSLRVDSVALPSAGLPAAIPPKEPSKVILDGKTKNYKKQIQDQTQASVARTSVESSTTMIDSDQRWPRLRELAANESWERLLGLMQDWYPDGEHPELLGFFERHALERIDIRFAEFWINILIAAHQERRAIRYIVTKLSEEPHLAWARMVMPKIQKIVSLMDLMPVEWRESEGVLTLRDRVSQAKPRFGCYWAA
jgi:hypothetical protein